MATHAICTTLVQVAHSAASTSVANAAPEPKPKHPFDLEPGAGVRGRGAPEVTSKRLEALLGPVLNQYSHFKYTLSKKRTLGIVHPLEDGLVGACGACHLAGQPVVDEATGELVHGADGEVVRHPLHSLQADGCMSSVRYSKAATKQDAAGTAPHFIERILPVEGAEGAAFDPFGRGAGGDQQLPGAQRQLPGRGMRDICGKVDEHLSILRPKTSQPAPGGAAAAAVAAPPAPWSCNDFLADGQVPAAAGAARGSCAPLMDITGFFGLFCRHRFILLGCHMFSGERRAYLIGLLWTLVIVHRCVVLNGLYDIGPCQFRPTLQAFLRNAPNPDLGLTRDVVDLLKECLSETNWPLLPFHFYCHRAVCQAVHDAYLMAGTALQHGEGTEMKWSLFGRLVGRLKGMSKGARYGNIEYWWSVENMRQDVRAYQCFDVRSLSCLVACAPAAIDPELTTPAPAS